MRIVFFGTPDFAVLSLKTLNESGHDIAAVVTQPDKLKGRGHKLSMPPVKEYALLSGIPVIQPRGIRSEDFCSEMAGLRPDVIVVIAYGRIIPPPIIHLPPRGCINVHASLLPKYRGAAPIQWAIVNGDTKTGVTTMLMDEGLDTGDMLLIEETAITDDDNSASLGERLSIMGAGLLLKTLKGLEDGTVTPLPQIGESTYAPIIKKGDGRIYWSLSAVGIHNLVRGMYPWPTGQCSINGERLSVTRSRVVDELATGDAGKIVRISFDELHVMTGMGVIALKEVTPEGRKPMSGAAFANGRHLKEGSCFDA